MVSCCLAGGPRVSDTHWYEPVKKPFNWTFCEGSINFAAPYGRFPSKCTGILLKYFELSHGLDGY